MAQITVSIERLVSEGDYCNYRVSCTISDTFDTEDNPVSLKEIEAGRLYLHQQCRDHVRAVVEARTAQIQRERLMKRHQESAEDYEDYAQSAEEAEKRKQGEIMAARYRENARQSRQAAFNASVEAAAVVVDEDWLPF